MEVEQAVKTARQPESTIGADLGVTSLAVLSNGEVIANPKHLERAQRALRRLQRRAARGRGPDRRTGHKPSNRWRKTRARIARLHARVAAARRDGLEWPTGRVSALGAATSVRTAARYRC
ncbi:transposase [Nocardia sp. CA-120079]|uniref:transposase n=1 Tax=Nocardia sp. CA-120079 TaxID=3239974 RepID=UPI003D97087A